MSQKHTMPLVFIHGSFASAGSWRKIINICDNDHQCIAFDLPGHGTMQDPDDFNDPTLKPEFDALIHAIKDKVAPDAGIHLIGHSYGGVVALAAAMKSIVPVNKLTLFEPVDVAVLPIFGDHETLAIVDKFVDKYREASKQGEQFACGHVIDFWGGEGSFDVIPGHVQKMMATMTRNNLRHWDLCKNVNRKISDFEAFDIPITLVNGGRSNIVAKIIATSLDQHLPNSHIEIIDGASHFMVSSHPQGCADIICK